MTVSQSAVSLENAQLLSARLKATPVSELPDDLYKRIMEAQKTMLEHRYMQMPDTSKNPTYKEYAQVVVNGKTVAEIDNHGWTKTSNALGGALQANLPNEANGVISGPGLAQARAEYIARMLGGEVVKSATAMTQQQFNAVPQPKPTINYEAMKQDPLYEQLQKTRQAHTEYMTQQMAQGDVPEEVKTAVVETVAEAKEQARMKSEEAKQKFLDYMSKTPEERYYEAILREMGLTKEELEALPPDERAKVEEKIKDEITKRMATQRDEQAKKEENKV